MKVLWAAMSPAPLFHLLSPLLTDPKVQVHRLLQATVPGWNGLALFSLGSV